MNTNTKPSMTAEKAKELMDNYEPKTELCKKLLEARDEAKRNYPTLLSVDEINELLAREPQADEIIKLKAHVERLRGALGSIAGATSNASKELLIRWAQEVHGDTPEQSLQAIKDEVVDELRPFVMHTHNVGFTCKAFYEPKSYKCNCGLDEILKGKGEQDE